MPDDHHERVCQRRGLGKATVPDNVRVSLHYLHLILSLIIKSVNNLHLSPTTFLLVFIIYSKLEQSFVDDLNMKTGEELAFVVQRFYNKDEVRVLGEASSGGKFGATAFSFVSVSMKVSSQGLQARLVDLPVQRELGGANFLMDVE